MTAAGSTWPSSKGGLKHGHSWGEQTWWLLVGDGGYTTEGPRGSEVPDNTEVVYFTTYTAQNTATAISWGTGVQWTDVNATKKATPQQRCE